MSLRSSVVLAAVALSACGGDEGGGALRPAPAAGAGGGGAAGAAAGGAPSGGSGGAPSGGAPSGGAPPGGSGGIPSGGAPPAGGAAGAAGGTTFPPGDFDLTGTWATRVQITATVLGQSLQSTQYYLGDLTQTGTNVAYSVRICDYSIPGVQGVATLSVPPALQQLIRSKVVTGSGAYLSGTGFGARYAPPRQLTVLGAALANEAADPLPTQQNLSAALDEDQDGHPGVTLDADVLLCPGTQQLYVALRLGATLDGIVQDASTIVGTANAETEQQVLGYSNSCLSASATVPINIQPGSPYRQVRVDGGHGSVDLDTDGSGAVTCDELVAGIPVAFP